MDWVGFARRFGTADAPTEQEKSVAAAAAAVRELGSGLIEENLADDVAEEKRFVATDVSAGDLERDTELERKALDKDMQTTSSCNCRPLLR